MTKIENEQQYCWVLNRVEEILPMVKLSKAYYYMNIPLMNLFLKVSDSYSDDSVMPMESVS